jgi:hypothetical protein
MRNFTHRVMRVIALSTAAVAATAAAQEQDTKATVKRDASGRLVITNVGTVPPTTTQPATQSSPGNGQPLSIPSPATDAVPIGFARWPFSTTNGDASTVRIGTASLPNQIVLARATDGNPIAIKATKSETTASAALPYHGNPSYVAMPNLTFVGEWNLGHEQRPQPTFEGIQPTTEWVNYYLGDDRRMWQTKLPVHHGLRVGDIARGLELTYMPTETLHRYRLTIKPEFDLSKLVLSFSREASIGVDGSLITQDSGVYRVRNPRPRAWHTVGGIEVPVTARWDRSRYGMGAPTLAFERNDPQQALHVEFDLHRFVAMPVPDDEAYRPTFLMTGTVAVDDEQNVYVAGTSRTVGIQLLFDYRIGDGYSHENGRRDVIVQKFKPNGELVYTTFIGGAGEDGEVIALAADGKGNLFIAASAWTGFVPLTAGEPCKQDCAGVLVAKLGREGDLLDSRAVGGIEGVKEMVVDQRGILYVAGDGRSPALEAATRNGWLPRGDYRGYVAKIDASKSGVAAILWATNLGWLSSVQGIAVDAAGHVYVGGSAFVRDGVRELLPSPGYRSTITGSGDAFILELDPARSGAATVVASTFIGGEENVFEFEGVSSIDVDDAGNVYAGGSTTASGFPTTERAWSRTGRGGSEGFVCKFNPSLKELRWSTLLGGTGKDAVAAVRVDRDRNIHVTGTTTSQNFPLILSPPSDHANESTRDNREVEHLFAAKISSTGSKLIWSTVLTGGRMAEHAAGHYLAVNRDGTVFVVGDSAVRYEMPKPLHSDFESEYSLGLLTVTRCEACPDGPSISKVTRNLGSSADIAGRGFHATANVFVGGMPTNITSRTGTNLTVTVPLSTGAEEIEITVVNPDDQSASASLPPPAAAAAVSSTGLERIWPIAGAVAALAIAAALVMQRRRRA